MAAEEKANQLVDSFKPYVNGYVGSSMLTNTEYPEVILSMAKQCALIAVDEIIGDIIGNGLNLDFNERFNYWQRVKYEIEKL